MPGIRLRAPNGSRWTLKQMAQGKPLGHPSHAALVHFPVGGYFAALALDALSRTGRFPQAPVAARWILAGAVAFALLTAGTGLIDWLGMAPGSTKRVWATRHMLTQLAATALFAIALGLRWTHPNAVHASVAWLALEAAGAAVLIAGNWIGGVLVYEMGMRVNTAKPKIIPAQAPSAGESRVAESRLG
jgi:uncharacterized membrane protein